MRNSGVFSRSLKYIFLGILASVVSFSAFAQRAARITKAIDESSRTTLAGNISSFARPEFDRGSAPLSQQLTNVKLVLSRSDEQEQQLKQFLDSVQDRNSPNYHKWLTPAEFGNLYGPSDQDVQVVTTWLESHGLTVNSVSPGKNIVEFSGSVGQIQDTFQTTIHSFRIDDVDYYANIANPWIPAAMASVVHGIARLNNFPPKSTRIDGGAVRFNASTGLIEPLPDSSSSRVKPNLTYQSSSGYNYLYVVPADAATIYNSPNAYNANFSGGTSYNGSGVTIGIAADSNIDTSFVTAYRTLFLGNNTPPTITVVGTNPGINSDAQEAYLDAEIAGGLAPGAAINVYVSKDLFSGIEQAISDNKVDILSVSFGLCERGMTTSDNTYVYQLWQQAAAQGISVTVSTGDSGSAGCDDQNSQTSAKYGLAVNGLASTPYNIAVGGTDYDILSTNFSTYATAPSSSGSSAGSSSTYYRTAKSYVPENPWNDSTQINTAYSNNVPLPIGSANIVGAGGGKSSCATNTTTYGSNNTTTLGNCTAGWPKPNWQTGTNVPSDGVRDIPDVSFLAADGFYSATWAYCYPNTSKNINYCIKDSSGGFPYAGVGGTSAATPAFAGMLAMVVQAKGSRQGQAAQNLYQLYNGSHAGSVFNDVTIGNISVPCTSGTTNCSRNTAGYYFLTGYDAGAGYDLATGLGSVNVTNMINYWSSTTTGTQTATVTVTPSATSITRSTALNLTVTVSGSGTTPSGTVKVAGGGYTGSATALTNGSATISIPANSLDVGSDTLTVTYSGDSNYATATGLTTVTVTGTPTATVTVTPSATSLSSSDTLSVAVSVTGSGAITPTGSVTITGAGYPGSVKTLTNGSVTITIPANSLAVGTDTLTATYSGDTTYASASGTTSVTVTSSSGSTAPSFTLSNTVASSSVAAGSSATATITATQANGYQGAIALTCAVTTAPSGANSSYYPGCSFSSSSVSISGSTTTATSTLTITTTVRTTTTSQNNTSPVNPWYTAGGGVALSSVFLLGFSAYRRKWRALLGAMSVFVVMLVLGGLSGCGGGGGGGSKTTTTTGTTAGNYVITVTGKDASSSGLTTTTTVSITVN